MVGAAARGQRTAAYTDSRGRLTNRWALRMFTIRLCLADGVFDTLVGVAREIGHAVISAAGPLAAARSVYSVDQPQSSRTPTP